MKNKKTLSWIGTIFFTILGLVYIAPIIIVLFNSFKKKSFINLEPFKLPSAKNFIGLDNYTTALNQYGLLIPTNFASLTVVNSQKDSPTPIINGAIKPMINAARVGKTNIGR